MSRPTRAYAVPTLLLQPLVENAIKHGIALAPRAGLSRFAPTATTAWCGSTIEDTGVGFSPGALGHLWVWDFGAWTSDFVRTTGLRRACACTARQDRAPWSTSGFPPSCPRNPRGERRRAS